MHGIIAGQIITRAMQDQFTYGEERPEDERPTWTDRWGKRLARLATAFARNERYPHRPRRRTRGAYAARS